MYVLTGKTRIALLALSSVLMQGCATSERFCAGYVETEAYYEAPDHKAIAQYFDRETKLPPITNKDISNECWIVTEVDSREKAEQLVTGACNDSLREMDRFTEWNCVVVAQGSEIALTEKLRMEEYAYTNENYRERNFKLERNDVFKGPARPDTNRTQGPKIKDKQK